MFVSAWVIVGAAHLGGRVRGGSQRRRGGDLTDVTPVPGHGGLGVLVAHPGAIGTVFHCFPRLHLNGGIMGGLIPSLSPLSLPSQAHSGFFNIFYEQAVIL